MKEFVKRLSSRKFLLTIVLIAVVTLFPDVPDTVVGLALTFIGAEGLKDVVAAYKQGDVSVAQLEKETALVNMGELPAADVDRGGVVPGAR